MASPESGFRALLTKMSSRCFVILYLAFELLSKEGTEAETLYKKLSQQITSLQRLRQTCEKEALLHLHLHQIALSKTIQQSQTDISTDISSRIEDQLQKFQADATARLQESQAELYKDVVSSLSRVIETQVSNAVQTLRDEIPGMIDKQLEKRFGKGEGGTGAGG
ncbi:hypothetical protein BDV95DRAFT_615676 [Massariosphaeria phaeospora]|uniref:Uncharacterized protein n=1 Tax=Massariosphaeria phaeospora TaxID=100035 RepID=A0A7C8MEF9_9PLEO|nr:hypothetical protein BDV95DRAFT_615676 [Massariosphaeria phaeospora]